MARTLSRPQGPHDSARGHKSGPGSRALDGWFFIVGRMLALCLGGVLLVNVAGRFRHAGFDTNGWLFDLRPIPPALQVAILGGAGLLLVAFALGNPRAPWLRRGVAVVALAFVGVAGANAVVFYRLVSVGRIATSFPLPFSLLVAGACAWIAACAWRRTPSRMHVTGSARILWLVKCCAVAMALCLAFPIAQMWCFGKTDYRRPADVVVIFGAGVYASGEPSDALKDRIRTGCALYMEGLCEKVIVSGGPGMGPVHETTAMREMAKRLGVKPADIVVDTHGINTEATVRNTCGLFKEFRWRRVLAVSHAYHLPRIKMTYQRAGVDVYTVPAKESYLLAAMPYYILREVAALWFYYVKPLVG